ncbi:ATP-binding protein [Nonomuraea lactucae]|uniref:ATP-binding protein n=1 Tax=Nonomuraea lactucae TaxID=2249762 RepID=UPI000DE35A74|nr:ATP-binding protein [Nonomuraea lactucae]
MAAEEGGLGRRLAANRSRTFVGRAAELSLFRSALDGDPGSYPVLYVHGPGGIGKSGLLRRMAEEARAAGRTVVEIDGRTVGSPEVFEARALGALAGGQGVLMVDTFEQCQGLEEWLRESFLPRLPAGALAVLAGRRPPDPAWRADPAWAGVLGVAGLRNLPPDDAAALLDACEVPAHLHEALLSYAGGHPLALCLAAEVALRHGGDAGRWTPTQDVVGTLLARLVGELPSAAHRNALEACAHVRFTTEELLQAALPEQDVGELFAWLRCQPYVESGGEGLFPHDVARDALDADLRWRDPGGYEAMHHRVRAHLVERARRATGPDVLPAALDLNYLHRGGGLMPRFVTWRGDGDEVEDAFRPEDRAAVLALAAEAEGEESAAVVDFWLDRQPLAFHVHRRPGTGEPVAFMAWLRLAEPREDENTADPVVASAWEHTRAAGPIREGEHVALARFMVHPAAYQRPSPVMDLMLMRVLAGFIQADRMAWSYVVLTDPGFWAPLMTYADHRAIEAAPSVAGRAHALFAHDWRAVPLEPWLDLVGSLELSGPREGAPGRARELAVLSRPEFDTAVRDALRGWHHARALAANPLTRSRLIADRHSAGDPAETLREVVVDAVDALREERNGAKLHRALATTYFHGVPRQEAAAERLGLPFSTYRRHLDVGVRHVCDLLWDRELHGVTTA